MLNRAIVDAFFLTAVVLSGCATSAHKSENNSFVNQQEKPAVTVQTTPSPSATKRTRKKDGTVKEKSTPPGYSLPAESGPEQPVAETGKETGGKTIRVRFTNGRKKQIFCADGVEKPPCADEAMLVVAKFTNHSAIYRATWVQGTTDVYLVNAKAGQVMTVKISTEKEDGEEEIAAFDVFNVRTNRRLEGGNLIWSQKLPETGEYAILVVGGYGYTYYTLEISVK